MKNGITIHEKNMLLFFAERLLEFESTSKVMAAAIGIKKDDLVAIKAIVKRLKPVKTYQYAREKTYKVSRVGIKKSATNVQQNKAGRVDPQ